MPHISLSNRRIAAATDLMPLLAVFLACLLQKVATTAVWKAELPRSCGEIACPDEQCWNISLRNPYPDVAAWSATIHAPSAVNAAVVYPLETDLVHTLDDGSSLVMPADVAASRRSGVYALEWAHGPYRCTDEASSLEICLTLPGTAPPSWLSVTYDPNSDLCRREPSETQEDVPQFVVITWDDAFSQETFKQHLFRLLHENLDIRDACGGFPRHTLFVSNDNTDYAALGHLLNYGAEYALHTVHHEDIDAPTSYWRKQLEAGRRWAQRLVPSLKEKEKWRPTGFRAPWLAHTASLYEAIQATDGISYDSSIPSYQRPIWPYALEEGAHDGCDAGGRNGSCPEAGVYTGIWEFPLNPLISDKDEVFLFDPPGTAMETWKLLKHHLQRSYETDRAPMTISLHSRHFFDLDAEQKHQVAAVFAQATTADRAMALDPSEFLPARTS